MDSRDDDPVQTGRTILTALYLCMLGVCFLVPIFFYFRMHCDERRNRHLRDLEIAGMTRAMNESQAQQREESRAARRKYREERRARIIQLFAPVRMILTEENFTNSEKYDRRVAAQTKAEIKANATNKGHEIPRQSVKIKDGTEEIVPSRSHTMANDGTEIALDPLSSDSCFDNAKEECIEDGGVEDFIVLPKPGLPHGAAIYEFNTNTNSFLIANNHKRTNQKQDDIELRKVPNECSICLCEYTPGSDIVWSSNPECNHVFHKNCIEQWLMKQRDGPLCPCCRRDFVVDPFDFGQGETDDLEKGVSNTFASISDEIMSASTSIGRSNLETAPLSDDVEETVIAMLLAASFTNSIARTDGSDGSAVDVLTQSVADDPNINGSSNYNSRARE